MVVKKKKKKVIKKSRGLPTKKKKPEIDIEKCSMLFYGREKIGKTSACASFPNSLFLTTEPGTKGMEIYEFNSDDGGCHNWELIREAADLLEKNSKQFSTVVIDTVDRAYDMCLDWVCDKQGIPYPGEDKYGVQDHGKSWRFVKNEFTSIIYRIVQSGHGIIFTSHAKETSVKAKGGTEYSRIFPSMGNQARSVIEGLVDMFFYFDYISPGMKKESKRVIITQGNELVWAGSRKLKHTLPKFLPLTEEGCFEILTAAANGENVGLDASTLIPTMTANETIKKFYRDAKSSDKSKTPERGARRKKKIRK